MLKMTCHLGYTPVNESYQGIKYSFADYLRRKPHEEGQWWKHVFEGVSMVQDICEKDTSIEDPSEEWRPTGPFERFRDGKVQYHYQKHFHRADSV